MSVNAALVTTAAKQAAQDSLDFYATAVAEHMAGDWGGHLQVKVHDLPYIALPGTGLVSPKQLRLQGTDVNPITGSVTDWGILVPCFLVGDGVAPTPLPLITVNPTSVTVVPGTRVELTVIAASRTALRYQWRKGGVNIVGEAGEQSVYVIQAVASTNQGTYDCLVTNDHGTVASQAATITVTDP